MSSLAIPVSLPKVPPVNRQSPRIDVIQDLRGFAALSVCWYHFAYDNGLYAAALPNGMLRTTAHDGWLGVQIFFVISGFILPYSLFRAHYQASLGNFGRFLLKRLSRLEPPYLISIAMMLGVIYIPHLVPWLNGSAPKVAALQLLLHLGYLNSFFHQGWYVNPVYWTLGIEFQYYLLIGLMYPLLASRNAYLRVLAWGLIGALALGDHFSSLSHNLSIFALGFAIFQYRTHVIAKWEFGTVFLLAAVGCLVILGKSVTLVGLATCVVILFVRRPTWLTSALGDLSYSLYLVHLPIGGIVFRFTQPWGNTLAARLAVVAAAIAASIAAAYAMYRWVEKPCLRYAGSLRFQKV